MEDLLERLEAAELLIAFATVCSKVQSRYAAQVFNYGLTGRPAGRAEPPLRFRMIIRLPLFPVYFRQVLRYVYANYRRGWNRLVNRIIFRWRSRQMSRERAPTRQCRRIAMLRNDRSISSLGNAAMTTLMWCESTTHTRNDWIFVTFVLSFGPEIVRRPLRKFNSNVEF